MNPVPFPALPGLTVRHVDPDADIAAVLSVHDACRARDAIDRHSVCYTVPNLDPKTYSRLLRESPPGATLIAEARDALPVAHAWMEAWGYEERLYLWRVWVRPEWRGRGVGTALLHWGEARARELHGDDGRHALHLANATEGEADAVLLLRNQGYRLAFVSPELAFDAFDDLPPVPDVPGVVPRALAPTEHRAVAHALCEANLNPPDHGGRWTGDALETRLQEEEGEWLARVAQSDPALTPVAWDGDAVAGAYLCRRAGAVGEVAQVAVRHRWRGRGIARALAIWSLHALRDAGCVTARLFTSTGPDEDEPTTGPYAMYRKFGFYPIARHLRFRKPFAL